MPEILEGKMKPFHSDPAAVRKATITMMLMPCWVFIAFNLGIIAYHFGAWIGEEFLQQW